jgi:hypothetical protein
MNRQRPHPSSTILTSRYDESHPPETPTMQSYFLPPAEALIWSTINSRIRRENQR